MKPEQQPVKTYSSIVKGNRAGDSAFSLKYVEPGEYVEISADDWDEGGQIWNHAVMGMVVSQKPSYAEMCRWVEVNWKSCKPSVTQLKPGVFIFQFSSEAEKMGVLGKHWSFYHRYQMVIRSWNVDKGIEDTSMDTVPVWIQLPGLHPRLWSNRSLGKITSFVGEPIATDHMTAHRTRMDYARVLVEVNTRKPLPTAIPIRNYMGETTTQSVLYEWNTKKCGNCNLIGHSSEQCKRKLNSAEPAVPLVVQEREPASEEGTKGNEIPAEQPSKPEEVINVPNIVPTTVSTVIVPTVIEPTRKQPPLKKPSEPVNSKGKGVEIMHSKKSLDYTQGKPKGVEPSKKTPDGVAGKHRSFDVSLKPNG